jgi:phosphate acetyltransferase
LIDRCQAMPPTSTAVVHPCDETSLQGAIEAARLGLIAPILVGPRERIQAVAAAPHSTSPASQIVDAPYSQAAAAKAVELVREGKAEALMKGSLHTDELMAPWSARDRPAHRAARQPLLRDGRAGHEQR